MFRSICEACFDDERQTYEEEEDDYKEVHTQPLFQRIIHIWSTLWTDPGKTAQLCSDICIAWLSLSAKL